MRVWYVRNSDLHRDLEIDTVDKEIQRFARKHEERTTNTPVTRLYHSWTTVM
jgi:hypothetical protein